MKKYLRILFLASLHLTGTLYAQKNNDYPTFLIDSPTDWMVTENKDVLNNLNQYKLTETELNKFISDHKGSVMLKSYFKYNQSEHFGLIPIIQVNLRLNTTRNFEEFFMFISNSAAQMKQHLNNLNTFTNPILLLSMEKKQSVFFQNLQ